MPDRLWIPAAYVDEVCPPGRANPDAWIGAPAGDLWHLAPCDEGDEPDVTLLPGQIVEFAWVESLGHVVVKIRDDGTHVARDHVPAGVTHFTFGFEVIGDTLDDFVRQWHDLNLELDDDRQVLVAMARWSDEPERFQFDITGAGPRFIRANPPREPAQRRGAP